MKKYKIVLIILLVFISISIVFGSVVGIVYANRYKIHELFWSWLGNELTYERFLDVGHEVEVVSWPDDIYDKTYIITMYDKCDKRLEYVKNGKKITLLNSVFTQQFIDSKFYVIATNGYAVIDKNKNARIYTSEDKVSLENIHYLTRFEDFEKEEQELFKRFMW